MNEVTMAGTGPEAEPETGLNQLTRVTATEAGPEAGSLTRDFFRRLGMRADVGLLKQTWMGPYIEEAMSTLTHLGPYEVCDVTDDMVADVVIKQGVPIIIKQEVNGQDMFAVLARDKDLKIACATCFDRGMRINDTTRCRKCCSFVKHHDKKNGERIRECKKGGFNPTAECRTVTLDCSMNDVITKPSLDKADTGDLIAELERRDKVTKVLEEASPDEFANELRRRGLEESGLTDQEIIDFVRERKIEYMVTTNLDTDDLVKVVKDRGVDVLRGARRSRVLHELRRQARNVGDMESYYGDERKRSCWPHHTDKIGAIIFEKATGRRAKKKQKSKANTDLKEGEFVITRFEPQAANDLDV